MFEFFTSIKKSKKITDKINLIKWQGVSRSLFEIKEKLVKYYNKKEIEKLDEEKLNLFNEFSVKYTQQLMNDPCIKLHDIDPSHFLGEYSKLVKEKFFIHLTGEERQFIFQYVNNIFDTDIRLQFEKYIENKDNLERYTSRKQFKEFAQVATNFFSKFSNENVIYIIVATNLFFQLIGYRSNDISASQRHAFKSNDCVNSNEINLMLNLASWFVEALIVKCLGKCAINLIDNYYLIFNSYGSKMVKIQSAIENIMTELSEDLLHHLNSMRTIKAKEIEEGLKAKQDDNLFLAYDPEDSNVWRDIIQERKQPNPFLHKNKIIEKRHDEEDEFVNLIERSQDESRTFKGNLHGFTI